MGTVEKGGSAPGGSRTPNLQIRSLALYPIELRAQKRWGEYGAINHTDRETAMPSKANGALPDIQLPSSRTDKHLH